MIARIKTISFGILVVALIITITLMVADVEFYGLLSVYVFMVLWSLHKIFLWFIGDEFGIAVQVKIKKDAPKAIRFLGLLFVCFVFYFVAKGLIKHVST
ncbi:hypothetical protein AYI92_08405 [Shewanella xiamenensis]|uniref:hypothetical protein n=1 Tax=Shewanella xiamenensis TaxID=332186 RepID=UPI001185966D|nr:hypothetical protein [Shewanella xiamenensis]TVL23807.1 hypothetical protein AYI90_02455 [Shewanella xiamenensis]TVL24372.1 hypothetical protein AYI91_02455 [Shewanella xiamenensis]TVL26924.1 hypothetical protein AYI92_08405 [Shewanella xiamenensis]TVL37602.1 hypothetical protein AYI93_01595 [Shewanella xiamenensis]TVP05339.1 hypothetical protein AYI89_02680 [Shewanella xiamenensis]